MYKKLNTFGYNSITSKIQLYVDLQFLEIELLVSVLQISVCIFFIALPFLTELDTIPEQCKCGKNYPDENI